MHLRQTDSRNTSDPVTVIGVTGGVGAGKSRILQILEKEYGAHILLADEEAARLEEPGGEGYRLLVNRFGTGILGKDGRLDRKAFAEMIFKNPEALREVNEMIHPLTWKILCEKVEGIRALCRQGKTGPTGAPRLVVVEAALFDESSRQLCDALWYVDASEENRIERLIKNRGYSRKKCQDIMKNQPCREQFLRLADQVIDNNWTVEEVRAQLARLISPPAGEAAKVK